MVIDTKYSIILRNAGFHLITFLCLNYFLCYMMARKELCMKTNDMFYRISSYTRMQQQRTTSFVYMVNNNNNNATRESMYMPPQKY